MNNKMEKLKIKAADTPSQRLLNVLSACEEAGIEKDTALTMFITLEFEKVWGKLEEFENSISEHESKIEDLENLPASEFPRGDF